MLNNPAVIVAAVYVPFILLMVWHGTLGAVELVRDAVRRSARAATRAASSPRLVTAGEVASGA